MFETNQGALVFLKMFHPAQIKFCAMHSLNLGYGVWLLGSVLKVLVTDYAFFGGADMSESFKLQNAWIHFRDWCQQRKITSLVNVQVTSSYFGLNWERVHGCMWGTFK